MFPRVRFSIRTTPSESIQHGDPEKNYNIINLQLSFTCFDKCFAFICKHKYVYVKKKKKKHYNVDIIET